MICEALDAGRLRFVFSEPEAYFVVNVMARLAAHYRQDMAQLPPAQRAYWLGQGSLPPGTMKRPGAGSPPEAEMPPGSGSRELQSAEEILAEARLELRPERLALAENWVREFEVTEKRDPWSVEVSSSERDDFLAMINDRRLLLALEHGITEAEMDSDPGQIEDEERRSAILEIYFLGRFIFTAIGPQIYRP